MPDVDYLVIDDSEVEPGAPILSSLGVRWRDNAIAIAQGASGAPRIENDALLETTVRENVIAPVSASTAHTHFRDFDSSAYGAGTGNTFATVWSCVIGRNGSYRIDFVWNHNSSGNTQCSRVAVNGGSVSGTQRCSQTFGPRSENHNIAGLSAGDVLQIQTRGHTSTTTRPTVENILLRANLPPLHVVPLRAST